jgi:C-terminal processing protease CtpA/Prc
MDRKLVGIRAAVLIVAFGFFATNGLCQKITGLDRERAQVMLKEIASDIRKHYYDPKFHGVDWESKVEEFKQKINEADSMNRALSQVAGALDLLDDSHTFFLPPSHAFRHNYGWKAQMIGTRCFVIRVRPGSDADKKGVKPGDELTALNGYGPNRDNFWKMEYVYETLRPQPAMRLGLRDPAGQLLQVDAAAAVVENKRVTDLTGGDGGNDIWDLIRQQENADHVNRAQFSEVDSDVGILEFPGFYFSESEIDDLIGKARKHRSLVLDLRGNPGGSVETLKYLIGSFFENEVKVCDRVSRSERRPIIVKPHGHPFTGKLVVLVDSKSASAAEVFARVVQIEKRGTVLGDRSSGSVMEAKHYDYQTGTGTVVFYGASITDADLVMADGMSLEHKGVAPDEVVLPSAQDLAKGFDPVMARAAETVGGKLSPEAAGKLFPYEWPKL